MEQERRKGEERDATPKERRVFASGHYSNVAQIARGGARDAMDRWNQGCA